jgi:hypothetical protein
MSIPGVSSVMIGYNFVSVTKSDEGDWEVLDMKTRDALKEHASSGEPAVNGLSLDKPAAASVDRSEIDKKIALIKTQVSASSFSKTNNTEVELTTIKAKIESLKLK